MITFDPQLQSYTDTVIALTATLPETRLSIQGVNRTSRSIEALQQEANRMTEVLRQEVAAAMNNELRNIMVGNNNTVNMIPGNFYGTEGATGRSGVPGPSGVITATGTTGIGNLDFRGTNTTRAHVTNVASMEDIIRNNPTHYPTGTISGRAESGANYIKYPIDSSMFINFLKKNLDIRVSLVKSDTNIEVSVKLVFKDSEEEISSDSDWVEI